MKYWWNGAEAVEGSTEPAGGEEREGGAPPDDGTAGTVPDGQKKEVSEVPSDSEPDSRQKPGAPEPAEAARPHFASGCRLFGEALYGLDSVSSSSPAVHSGRIALGIRLFRRLFISADYTIGAPIRVASDRSQGKLELDRYPFSFGVRYYWLETGRWQLGAGVLVEINLLQETISPAEDSQRALRQGELKTQVSLVPTGYAAVRLVGTLFAGLHLGMRLLLWEKTDYFELIDGEKALLYATWRVQLRFGVGLTMFFL